MPGDQFLDTNVQISAIAATDARSAQAESLLANGGVIGVQVLNEFTNVTRRKLAWEWPQTEAALGVIEDLLGPALPLTMAIHSRAVALARDHTMAFYDALIVAAAIDARCRVLLSEDLQHGRKFGSLTINNPFR